MTGLRDDQLRVRVHHVAGEVLAVTRVVETGHGHSGETGTAERKNIVGRVVQQDTDMRRTPWVQTGAVQRGETLRLGQQLSMGPDPVTETQRRSIAAVLRVAPEQRAHVRCGQGNLGKRRSKGDRGRRIGGRERRGAPLPSRFGRFTRHRNDTLSDRAIVVSGSLGVGSP